MRKFFVDFQNCVILLEKYLKHFKGAPCGWAPGPHTFQSECIFKKGKKSFFENWNLYDLYVFYITQEKNVMEPLKKGFLQKFYLNSPLTLNTDLLWLGFLLSCITFFKSQSALSVLSVISFKINLVHSAQTRPSPIVFRK